jgi:pimeloyl-ACP methyl ester carboxylesterase
MEPVHVTEITAARATGPPAVFAHGIVSWGDDNQYGFGRQRPLGEDRRLLLMDRRGHGDSPDLAGEYRTDYDVDAQDIIELLGQGAHLVGHAYGAVAAMLAAAARPDLVRSLCVIQPGSMRVAEDDPVVAELLQRNRAASGGLPADLTSREYLRAITDEVGMPPMAPTPARLRAARTSMGERPCWDAPIPLEPIRDAAFPVLVIVGDWAGAPEEYRRLAGEPLLVAARAFARKVGGKLLEVPGFYPQIQEPARVNDALRGLWDTADASRRTDGRNS